MISRFISHPHKSRLYVPDVEELAGMAARRIAVAKFRASGLSWSLSRKQSLTAIASDELKADIKTALEKGADPRQAVHDVVEKVMEKK